jgi:hypothetical protein
VHYLGPGEKQGKDSHLVSKSQPKSHDIRMKYYELTDDRTMTASTGARG